MGADAETIAACATAPGRGGVAIIRLSGPRVPDLATQVFGALPPPRVALRARYNDTGGNTLDEGLLLYFPAPHSFTGEHVLEYHAHGSPVLVGLILERLAGLGVRLARPGEFSERAFVNGKLDLTQAEAIADLIECATESGLRAAAKSLQGVFSERVNALYAALTQLRVSIEAGIDFPDEEVDTLADDASLQTLDGLIQRLSALRREARQGMLLHDGLRVVIAGAPNAGKSSLLNAMTRQETALVTAIPGTTRDVIGARIQIKGVPVEIQDTAGLRASEDEVEKLGIAKARQALQEADVVIHLIDACQPAGVLKNDATEGILALNKCDLLTDQQRATLAAEHPRAVLISAKFRSGLDALVDAILSSKGLGEDFTGVFSARRRHRVALDQVWAHLGAAQKALGEHAPELAADDLRQAQNALGEITGMLSSDDLLGEIFSSFCIGK